MLPHATKGNQKGDSSCPTTAVLMLAGSGKQASSSHDLVEKDVGRSIVQERTSHSVTLALCGGRTSLFVSLQFPP